MIALVSIDSGSNQTDMMYCNVSKVYDQVEGEIARLYNPFIITLSKSAVTLTYPYTFKGVINNKPKEVHKLSGDDIWTPSEYLCDDDANSDSATCGFDYDENKNKIWDSQGFCCICTTKDAWDGSAGTSRFNRADLKCKVFGEDRAAGICMVFDELWYKVHEVGNWQMDFNIHVKAYDQVMEWDPVQNQTAIKWVEGGEIIIGPNKRRGTGIYNRILATFVGEFQSTEQINILSEKFLLIPYVQPGSEIDPTTHPQMKNGAADYLIVPQYKVELDTQSPSSCNKMGVWYTAFRNMGKSYGCVQKRGYCLENQPRDVFNADVTRRAEGKQPEFFPQRYGTLAGVKTKTTSDEFLLAFTSDKTFTSLVRLEISADDIILIYNRAEGIIVRAYATDFESLSHDGVMYVIAMNKGLVTADFSVRITDCSSGIGLFHEKSSSINPQQTKQFTFKIQTHKETGAKHFCVAQLYDSRAKLLDTTNVTFETFNPCICLPGCTCSCDETFECHGRDDKEWDTRKPEGGGLDLTGFVKLGKAIKEFFDGIADFFSLFPDFAQILMALLGGLIILGLLKAFGGLILSKLGTKVARGLFTRKGKNRARGVTAQAIVGQGLVADNQNQPDDQNQPDNQNQPDDQNQPPPQPPCSNGKKFLYDMAFFFIIPANFLKYLVSYLKTKWALNKPSTNKTASEENKASTSTEHTEYQGPVTRSRSRIYSFSHTTPSTSQQGGVTSPPQPIFTPAPPLTIPRLPPETASPVGLPDVSPTRLVRLPSPPMSTPVVQPTLPPATTPGVSGKVHPPLSPPLASVPEKPRNENLQAQASTISNDLSAITAPGSIIYYNFISPSPYESILQSPGDRFSLAGRLMAMPITPPQYIFELYPDVQDYQVMFGIVMKLTPARKLEARLYNQVLNQDEVMRNITATPRYPCLNH